MVEAITERPIQFTAESVRAILEGRKTQTRRAVKPQPQPDVEICEINEAPGFYEYFPVPEMGGGVPGEEVICPFRPGDRLWVQEPFRPAYDETFYVADGEPKFPSGEPYPASLVGGVQHPGKMLRTDSRINLVVIKTRVQRLREMSDGDARAEGYGELCLADGPDKPRRINHRHNFVQQWNRIHAELEPDGFTWDKNPWVWVIEFEVIAPTTPQTKTE